MPALPDDEDCDDTSSRLRGVLIDLRLDHQRILSELEEEHRRALCALEKKFECSCGRGDRVSRGLSFRGYDSAVSVEPGAFASESPQNSVSAPTFVLECAKVEPGRSSDGCLRREEFGHRERPSRASRTSSVESQRDSGVQSLFALAASPLKGTNHAISDSAEFNSRSSDEFAGGLKSSMSSMSSTIEKGCSSFMLSPSSKGLQSVSSNSRLVSIIDENEKSEKASTTLCQRKSEWSALGVEVQNVKSMRASMAAVKVESTMSIKHDGSKMTWHDSWVGSSLTLLRRSKTFEHICGAAILTNCVIMGAMSNFSAEDHYYIDHPPIYLEIADKACSLWFLLELALRLTVGPGGFFCGPDRWWNAFDFVLVSFDVIDNGLRLTLGSGGTPVKNLVALRLLRIFRVLRIVRLLKFCRELQLMLMSIRQCGRALVWALVLVALLIYLLSMYFLQSVTDHLMLAEGGQYDGTLKKQWGSIFAAAYTLYSVMSGGVSWMEVADPLIDIHWIHGLALFFFVFFMLFVVANIITSIFVDTAIQSNDREEVIQRKLDERDEQLKQMTVIFHDADEDNSGLISFEQFKKHMNDRRIRAYLRSVELDVTEATSLFSLLDTDKSGQISIDEFVFGCMRLKGNARSVDVAILMHDSKILHDQLKAIRLVQDAQANDWLLMSTQMSEVWKNFCERGSKTIGAENSARSQQSSGTNSPRNKKLKLCLESKTLSKKFAL